MTRRTWAGTLLKATGSTQAHSPLVSDVLIPLAGAVVTGILAGALAQALDWPGVVVGLAAALAAWLLRSIPTLPAVEVGAPKAELAQTVRLTIQNIDGAQGDYLSLGITPEQLQALAAGVARGDGLACRQWTGARATFSQAEYSRLRSVLIARGLARWVSDRDPRSGVVPTARGLATFKALAAPPHQVPGLQFTGKARDVKHANTATQ